ncbi:MAG: hypothetical protein N2170_07760, partial [Bacteroidia bacterium]|nr:hypothetical protein [Bacteroidia bacterium]
MYIPSKLTRLILLGLWLGARLWSQNCDTIVLVHAGQWHNHGDTLRTTSAFLTAYPRLMGGGGPGYVYTWYWWLQQISPAGNFSQSGSLSGSSPTLNTPLNPNASRPTFYELWLLLYRYGVTGGHVCTDSARIIVRVDTPPSNPWHHLCQDTFRLVIGGRQVRLGGTVQLPLGTYTFDFSPRDIIYWWTLTGPSGPQSGGAPNPPNASPVGTVHLSSAGRHTLTIAQYWPPCLGIVDTLKFYIDAINPSASHNCSTTVLSPCVPLLTIGNASYLPGPNPITLANGTYTFSLSSATPPAGVPLLINYYWQICGAGLPNGCLSGTGNSIT